MLQFDHLQHHDHDGYRDVQRPLSQPSEEIAGHRELDLLLQYLQLVLILHLVVPLYLGKDLILIPQQSDQLVTLSVTVNLIHDSFFSVLC
jgi:hypothetical protein